MSAKIINVIKGSLGFRAGLKPGDIILEINGTEVKDYLDYMYMSASERVEIKLKDRTVLIANPDYEPLGVEFETLLIDEPKSCYNKCIFCFIDQLPPNMRETCYFKDDDYRLSFLQGNYVTLTNLKDEELQRIIDYNIPRINISVHTTNPELRKKMLTNKNAGRIMEQLTRFAEGGLNMNAQIVLCRDINDGKELDRTLSDLGSLSYSIESVSIVPVGLSNYRDGLYPLRMFDKESAGAVIDLVEKWQAKFREDIGSNFVYLSDEFYILAEREFPKYEEYEDFPQIENGVGLCASLIYEFDEALGEVKNRTPKTEKAVVVGYAAYDVIKGLVDKLDGNKIHVYKIKNNFFGENITVSGLITGGDLIMQLKDKELGKEILITDSMLRHGEEVFLDDMTVSDVEEQLNVKVTAIPSDGYVFLENLLR